MTVIGVEGVIALTVVKMVNNLMVSVHSRRETGQGTGVGDVAAEGELRSDEGSDGGQEASRGGEETVVGAATAAAK